MTRDRSLVTFTAGSETSLGLEPRVQDALNHLIDLPSPTVADALALARVVGETGIRPGTGGTQALWEFLATVGAHDLGSARTLEPHLDALAILAEAGAEAEAEWRPGGDSRAAGVSRASGATSAAAATGEASAAAEAGAAGAAGAASVSVAEHSTWGVFASEGGATPLLASRTGNGDFVLTGSKAWCSLADQLDRALVTATLDDSQHYPDTAEHADGAQHPDPAKRRRQLFTVDLAHPGVTVLPVEWHPRGLSEIPSGPVRFDDVPATAVGEPEWYLTRPGFWWGAIGVAACWYGGAVGIARTLFDAASARPTTDTLLLMHLGAVDAQLNDGRRALAEAAALVDAGRATGADGGLLAQRVRATVARACESVLQHVAHALGPAPLAQNPAHAKRVADLELYLRQHHAEKDEAALGRLLVASTTTAAARRDHDNTAADDDIATRESRGARPW